MVFFTKHIYALHTTEENKFLSFILFMKFNRFTLHLYLYTHILVKVSDVQFEMTVVPPLCLNKIDKCDKSNHMCPDIFKIYSNTTHVHTHIHPACTGLYIHIMYVCIYLYYANMERESKRDINVWPAELVAGTSKDLTKCYINKYIFTNSMYSL